ncbi:MAG: hypothetical protein COA33_012030 [Fluviicola sp.]|nr:hypothetical protein [Fluviicola sp.]
MKLSKSQKIMRFFTSKERFAEIKKESIQWGFTCEECKERTSFWDIGGVRYKATGNPIMQFACPKCKVKRLQTINKLEEK